MALAFRLNFGLGFQVKSLTTFRVVPSKEGQTERESKLDSTPCSPEYRESELSFLVLGLPV